MPCYSNNGYSFRAWNDPNNIMDDEIYFDHEPTVDELNAAFPLYNSGVPELSIDDQADAIEKKYKPILDNYSSLILTAISADGTNQTAKVAVLQEKYIETINKKNLELEALFE